MKNILCLKSKDSHFACTCDKCYKEFMESLDKIWINPLSPVRNKIYLGKGKFFKFQQDLGYFLLKLKIIKRSSWKSPDIFFRYYL